MFSCTYKVQDTYVCCGHKYSAVRMRRAEASATVWGVPPRSILVACQTILAQIRQIMF